MNLSSVRMAGTVLDFKSRHLQAHNVSDAFQIGDCLSLQGPWFSQGPALWVLFPVRITKFCLIASLKVLEAIIHRRALVSTK